MSEITVTAAGREAVENLTGGLIRPALRYTRRRVALGAKTAYQPGPDDSGALIQALTTSTIITLPLAADFPGYEICVQNVGGAIATVIRPQLTDAIQGTVGAVTASGAAGADWGNPDATAVIGDYVRLVSDGDTDWWIVGGVGIWESGT
jgi:hypothetical protein